MSALAGRLGERVTLLVAGPRDALGGAGGWHDGPTLWAGVAPDGAGGGGGAGAAARWRVTLRATAAAVAAERLRWRGTVLRVRRVASDPAAPDRVVLLTEEER